MAWWGYGQLTPTGAPSKDRDPPAYRAWLLQQMQQKMAAACTPQPPARDFESKAERNLWEALRRTGVLISYQQNVPNRYGAGFEYCADIAYYDASCGLRIDVEVDGEFKDTNPQEQLRLQRRDSWFISRGWHVLRFHAHDCRNNPTSCARSVAEYVADATSVHRRAIANLCGQNERLPTDPIHPRQHLQSGAERQRANEADRAWTNPRLRDGDMTSTRQPISRAGPDVPRATGEGIHKVGDRVRHPTFGTGVVIGARQAETGDIVDVNFSTAGVKKLDLRYAPLTWLGIDDSHVPVRPDHSARAARQHFARAHTILVSETRDGHRNRIVVGGLAGFMSSLAHRIEQSTHDHLMRRLGADLTERFENYDTLGNPARSELVSRAIQSIESVLREWGIVDSNEHDVSAVEDDDRFRYYGADYERDT